MVNPVTRALQSLQTLAGIHRWARRPFLPNDAKKDARQLLATRADRFLKLARDAVYRHPRSPYQRLLRHAGCDYGDLETEVARNGLEAALSRLAAQGVYITHDEMKGKEPVRRGSAVFHFAVSDFDNPLATPHFQKRTSGSTGPATSTRISLTHYRQQLLHTWLSVAFHELQTARTAIWVPPSEWSVSRVLRLSKTLGRVDRWFTQLPVAAGQRASLGVLSACLRPYGYRLPFPCHVALSSPDEVVSWMVEQLRTGQRVLLVTFPATAARACALAARQGVSLDGAVLLIGGEPVTSAKRQVVESVGATCLPLFGCTETGESAEGCLAPSCADDMHLYEHKFALTTRRLELAHGQVLDSILFTTLADNTPKIFLNGDTGDAGVVEQRVCGCPWGELGYRTHLREVWSYAKLTAEGMTLPAEVVFSALEKLLPERFGGRAGDYQLIAEPGDKGVMRYLLAINPEIGPVDEDAAGRAFQEALEVGSYRTMTEFLREAGQLRVVRSSPVIQSGGKSLPVVLWRGGAREPGG